MGDGKMKQGGSSGAGKEAPLFFLLLFLPSLFFFFFCFTFPSWATKYLSRYLPSPLLTIPAPEESPASVWLQSPGYPCFPAPLYTRRLPFFLFFFFPSSLSLLLFFRPLVYRLRVRHPAGQARRLLLLGASDRLFLPPGAAAKPPPTPLYPPTPFTHPFLPHPYHPPVFHS